MTPSVCPKCGAAIYWIKGPHGALTAVDFRPVDSGLMRRVDMVFQAAPDLIQIPVSQSVNTYRAHRVTCAPSGGHHG